MPPVPPVTPASSAAPRDLQRLRASGGPEDRATYHCGCGVVFLAPVSTTVACPGCGDAQVW